MLRAWLTDIRQLHLNSAFQILDSLFGWLRSDRLGIWILDDVDLDQFSHCQASP